MAYTVTFWGTRGSIPTPGAHTARYGGNTPCVAVEGTGGGGDNGQGQLVILDAGTGIRALGRELVERQNGAVQAEILLSHAHWDHIQGLPHFKPFFAPGNAVRIWGSRQGTTSLEAILRQQMDPAVFPVPLDALSAKLTVQQVEAGEFTVGTFRVQAMRLRHPGTTLGYRLTPAAGGPSMAYVTDNELGPGGHYGTPGSWRRDFVTFLGGVELLIHDAMYTPDELGGQGRGQDTRPGIAVLPLDNGGSYGQDKENFDALQKGIAGMLISELAANPAARVVEREEIEKLLGEQSLGASGKVTPETAAKIGKLVGARYVIAGTFIDFYGDFRLDARLVNVETSEIVKVELDRMQRDHLFDIIRTVAARLMKDTNLPPLPRQASDQRLHRQIPTEALTFYSKALLYQDRGQKEKAAEMYQRALAVFPEYAEAQQGLQRVKSS